MISSHNDFHEVVETTDMPAARWQRLLAKGFDRVGTEFFRVRYTYHDKIFTPIVYERMPLRYRLTDFVYSKSQRKIVRINSDLRVVHSRLRLTQEKIDLFQRWSLDRFGHFQNIKTWVNDSTPTAMREICIYKGVELVACSFYDTMPRAHYSVLAFFAPEEKQRSLGTFTMLLEIERGMAKGKDFQYPGHSFMQQYMYEYKKHGFATAECYDWNTETWVSLPEKPTAPIIYGVVLFDK